MPRFEPTQNSLLAQLSPGTRERLLRNSDEVALNRGNALFETGVHASEVHFPLAGVISLTRLLADGEVGEVAMVGREGMLGVGLLIDADPIPTRAFVQMKGVALVQSARNARKEFLRGEEFQILMFRYVRALSAQMAQITMCTRRHSVEQQLIRWLLGCCERVQGDCLIITHEAIAQALCVRRGSITESLSRLQEAGLVACARRQILILDHAGLAKACCECHEATREDARRIFGAATPSPHVPARERA